MWESHESGHHNVREEVVLVGRRVRESKVADKIGWAAQVSSPIRGVRWGGQLDRSAEVD